MALSHLHVEDHHVRAMYDILLSHGSYGFYLAVTGSMSRSFLQKFLCVALMGQINGKM